VAHVFQKNDEHPNTRCALTRTNFFTSFFHGIVYCVQIKDHDSLPFFKTTDVLVTKLKCCSTAGGEEKCVFLPPMCVLYDSPPAAPRGVGSEPY